MAKWQGRSRFKPSGGRVWPRRKKRKYEMGRESAETKLGTPKKVKVAVRGGDFKLKLLAADTVNITDPKSGEIKKSKILSVLENPANPHFVRRNIITKGAVIETELGKVLVTSRPGQTGTVDGILLEAKAEKQETEKPPIMELQSEEGKKTEERKESSKS